MIERFGRHRGWTLAGGAVLLLGLAGGQAALGGGADPGDTVRADARRVHCLSAKQRSGLIETAVRLGEAAPGSTESAFRPVRKGRPGRPTTLDAWSGGSGDAFDRVCRAHSALTGSKALQDPAGDPPWWRRVASSPLFTLVLGAMLTLCTTWLAAGSVRRHTLADQLTTSAAAYLKAAENARAARARQAVVDVAGLEGSRVDLWSAIQRFTMPGSDQRDLAELLEQAHWAVRGTDFDRERSRQELDGLALAVARAARGEHPLAGEPAGGRGRGGR